MAKENARMSDSDLSPDSGDMWTHGCPNKPVWSSGGNYRAGSDGTSSFEDYEHTVDNLALEAVGQNWSSEVVSLFSEESSDGGGFELPHGQWTFHAKKCGDCVLGELNIAGLTSFTVFTVPEQLCCGFVTARKPLSPWTGSDKKKERDVVSEMKGEGTWATGWQFRKKIWDWVVWELFSLLFEFELACLCPSIFVTVWTSCAFFSEWGWSFFSHVCLLVKCVQFSRSEGGLATFSKAFGHSRKDGFSWL